MHFDSHLTFLYTPTEKNWTLAIENTEHTGGLREQFGLVVSVCSAAQFQPRSIREARLLPQGYMMTEDTQKQFESRYNDQVRRPPEVPTELPVLPVPSVAEPSARARQLAVQVVLNAVLMLLVGVVVILVILLLALSGSA